MYQKVVTDEDYPVTASEIDIETVTAPLESKTVVRTSGSEKEFTKSNRDVLEKSLSICHPQLSESTFMSNPKCSLRVSRRRNFPFRKQAMPFLTVDAFPDNSRCHL